jgi:hypothetical protein
MEGQLYKYTNVVRGFQVRYFVVNQETTKLDYYMVKIGEQIKIISKSPFNF